jgi:hypothetical protein
MSVLKVHEGEWAFMNLCYGVSKYWVSMVFGPPSILF